MIKDLFIWLDTCVCNITNMCTKCISIVAIPSFCHDIAVYLVHVPNMISNSFKPLNLMDNKRPSNTFILDQFNAV